MTQNKLKDRPIAVDLFAGAGGMTLGFEKAGFDVLASVEIDPIHCATHEFNFPFWSILCQSITDISGREIRDKSTIGNRPIDVVFGGPPCQGFSFIGKRFIDDPRNFLIFHFMRLVLELKPKYFVMENVAGLVTGNHRELLDKAIQEFNHNGYRVASQYQVLNAVNYGVPQDRKRLFILGSQADLNLPDYPCPITRHPQLNSKNNNDNLPLSPTVLDAIKDLPNIEKFPQLLQEDCCFVGEYSKPSSYGLALRGLGNLEDDYSYEREYDPRILTASLRTKHRPGSVERFAATLPGKIEPISRFLRLDPQGVCNTIRAGTASNRGAFTSPRPIHPSAPRCITVREAARLHSYPDWFRFHTTKWHGCRQIGNSVPPLLAKAVAAEIIRALGVSPCKPTGRQKLGDDQLLKFNMSQAAQYYDVDPRVIEPRKRVSTKQGKDSL